MFKKSSIHVQEIFARNDVYINIGMPVYSTIFEKVAGGILCTQYGKYVIHIWWKVTRIFGSLTLVLQNENFDYIYTRLFQHISLCLRTNTWARCLRYKRTRTYSLWHALYLSLSLDPSDFFSHPPAISPCLPIPASPGFKHTHTYT